jgi:hypothetical protein
MAVNDALLPWLSPAYQITARLLRDELNTPTTEESS